MNFQRNFHTNFFLLYLSHIPCLFLNDNLLLQELMSAENEIELQAAVLGFHYQRKYWKPKEGELLFCSHEFANTFDVFEIETCTDEGNIVGHLPREISRASKIYFGQLLTVK